MEKEQLATQPSTKTPDPTPKPKRRKKKKTKAKMKVFKSRRKKIVVACVWLAGRRRKRARKVEGKKRYLFSVQRAAGRDSKISKWIVPRLSNHDPSLKLNVARHYSFRKPSKMCGGSLTKHGLKTKKCVYKEENYAKGDGANSEEGGAMCNQGSLPGSGGKQKDVFNNAQDVPLLTKYGVLNKKDVFKRDKWRDELDIIMVYAVQEIFKEATGQGGECKDEVQLWLCDSGGSKEAAAAGAHAERYIIRRDAVWFIFI